MPYSIVMRTSLTTLALFASLVLPFAACSETTSDPLHEPGTAEKPFVPVNNPPTDLPPEQQKLLVPGAPAITEPIDIVRDLGKLLDAVTDGATAAQKRMAIDGRMLALRKKLPDWEHPQSAIRKLLEAQGAEGLAIADAVYARSEAVLKITEAAAVHPYLQQLSDMLKKPQ